MQLRQQHFLFGKGGVQGLLGPFAGVDVLDGTDEEHGLAIDVPHQAEGQKDPDRGAVRAQVPLFKRARAVGVSHTTR